MAGGLTCTRKGYYRDKAIVETIERFRAMDTEQVCRLFFTGSQAMRVAQRRLKVLTDSGKLHRARDSTDLPFWYYTGKKPAQHEHRLAVTWAYVWLSSKLKQWERLERFDMEQDYKLLRADALAAIRNTVTGKLRLLFIEADCSGNDFDKITKYNSLYATGGYTGAWWVKEAERFPPVVIITENAARRRKIERRITDDNTHGLEFTVHLLDEMKKEAMT